MKFLGLFVLGVLVFSVFSFGIVSGAYNYAAASNGATISEVGVTSGSASGSLLGVIGEDGTSGYWRRGFSYTFWGSTSATPQFTVEIDFDQTVPVLESIQYWTGYYGNAGTLNLWVRSDGSWVEVPGASTATGTSISGNWANVDSIKLKMANPMSATAYASNAALFTAYLILYEVEAIGGDPISYLDSGLKIQVSGSDVSIAAEPDAENSKVKFRNNGITYGLALVPNNDADGSGVKIRIDGTTYELRKL